MLTEAYFTAYWGISKSIHLTRDEFYQIRRFYISYMDSCRRKSNNRMKRSTKKWLYADDRLKITVFLADTNVNRLVDWMRAHTANISSMETEEDH